MQVLPPKQPSSAVFRRRRIVAILLVLAIFGGVGYLARGPIRSGLDLVFGAEYSGSGSGSTMVTIFVGDDGADVAHALVAAGVTKNFSSTYSAIIAANPIFYPGVYKLHLKMHSSEAIRALADKSNRSSESVLIKEGVRASTIFKILSDQYGIPVSEFEAVKPSDLGLPAEALNLDGYLFPAKYAFDPGQNAKQMLQVMFDRLVVELKAAHVAPSDYHRVVTFASVIQREGRLTPDFYKISRVFTNRLAQGIPLQSDATVSYGANSNTVSTTAAQRADDNPWNTYLHTGLPGGPISAPGALAIDAALHPADGTWLFFCTTNLETGETEFSTTLAQHEASVAKWRAWMRANPGW